MIKKRHIFSLLTGFLICANWDCKADSFSLFHSPGDLKDIRQNRQQKDGVRSREIIHLSGLLYDGKNKWRLWVNGQPLSEDSWPNLKVIDVTPRTVSFKIFHQGSSLFFTLAPNQYYSLRDYKVGFGMP